ncbi:MAG: SRPBCC family protein [Cytophagaceae bacterium]
MTTKTNLLALLMLVSGLKSLAQSKEDNNVSSAYPGTEIKKGKIIHSEILINAPVEMVWKIFSDFEQYPHWNPFIKFLKPVPREGKQIEVFLQPAGKKGMTFKPKVLVYAENKELRWVGKLFISRLFDGEHVFMLKDNHDGTSTFIQYERFRGILVPFMKRMLDDNTLSGFKQMNEALKKKCEE